MKKTAPAIEFYEDGYIAQAVKDILYDRFAYMRELNNFYGDGRLAAYLEPFKEYSALHSFIEFVTNGVIDEQSYRKDTEEMQDISFSETGKLLNEPANTIPVEKALVFYGIEHISFGDWLRENNRDFLLGMNQDHIADYMEELLIGGGYEELCQEITENVFSVLFCDRAVLSVFNDIMGNQVGNSDPSGMNEENARLFSELGVLKKAPIPLWVKESVYSRDKGCVICGIDIPDVFGQFRSECFQYIIPLAAGGLNDLSNVQTLCGICDPNGNDEHSPQQKLW